MSNPPAGWYPDPTGQPDTIRWWNGTQWTNKTERETPEEAAPEVTAEPEAAAEPETVVQPAVVDEPAVVAQPEVVDHPKAVTPPEVEQPAQNAWTDGSAAQGGVPDESVDTSSLSAAEKARATWTQKFVGSTNAGHWTQQEAPAASDQTTGPDPATVTGDPEPAQNQWTLSLATESASTTPSGDEKPQLWKVPDETPGEDYPDHWRSAEEQQAQTPQWGPTGGEWAEQQTTPQWGQSAVGSQSSATESQAGQQGAAGSQVGQETSADQQGAGSWQSGSTGSWGTGDQQNAGAGDSNGQSASGAQQGAAGWQTGGQQQSAGGWDSSGQQGAASTDTGQQQSAGPWDSSGQQGAAGWETGGQQGAAGWQNSGQGDPWQSAVQTSQTGTDQSGWGPQQGGQAQWQAGPSGPTGGGTRQKTGGDKPGPPKAMLIIAGAVGLVLIVVAGVFFVANHDDKKAEPEPTSSVPTTTPTDTPTTAPTSQPTTPPGPQSTVRPGQSKNPKLHEGGRIASDAISFPRQRPPWSDRKRLVPQLVNSSGQYVLLQEKFDGKNSWYADAFVGALGTSVLFSGDVKATAADLSAQLRSTMYGDIPVKFADLRNGAAKRTGKNGWYFQQSVTATNPKITMRTLTLTVAVFDLGDGTAVAYISDIPTTRPDLRTAEAALYKGINVG
ncbi:DUF2510 domain-containing protein [Kribbella sp. NPDC051770]|uniref:DUF2510 domain-containing protein n=1 Tax=Kribbella sp. NPDC051770 TaxID=3155413 RepID=UPI0034182E95